MYIWDFERVTFRKLRMPDCPGADELHFICYRDAVIESRYDVLSIFC